MPWLPMVSSEEHVNLAWLVVLTARRSPPRGRLLTLGSQETRFVIGSAASCAVWIKDDATIRGEHAEIVYVAKDNCYYVLTIPAATPPRPALPGDDVFVLYGRESVPIGSNPFRLPDNCLLCFGRTTRFLFRSLYPGGHP